MKKAPARSAGPPKKQRTKGKEKFLAIKERNDGTLVIEGGKYSVDEYNNIGIDMAKPIPRFRMEDLREYCINIRIEGGEWGDFTVSADDEECATIGFGFDENIRDWWGKIGLYTYIELLEACVELHPENSDIIEYSYDYIGSADARFEFAVKVTDAFLDDAISSALVLIETILQPIREIEKLIDRTIGDDDQELTKL